MDATAKLKFGNNLEEIIIFFQVISRCYATSICNPQTGILNSTMVNENVKVDTDSDFLVWTFYSFSFSSNSSHLSKTSLSCLVRRHC